MGSEKDYFPISFTQSWQWLADGFAPAFAWIGENENRDDAEVIWKTRHKYVKKIPLPEKLGGGFAVKKYYQEKRFLRYFLRPSLAAREARGFLRVKGVGIPTVEVLGFGENRDGFRLKDAFFITRFMEGLSDAGALVGTENRQDLLDFVTLNAQYLGRLHAAGFSHGGAHPRNFMWRRKDGQMEVVWLDLATVRPFKAFGRAARIRLDLADFLEKFSLSAEEVKAALEVYGRYHRFPGMENFKL